MDDESFFNIFDDDWGIGGGSVPKDVTAATAPSLTDRLFDLLDFGIRTQLTGPVVQQQAQVQAQTAAATQASQLRVVMILGALGIGAFALVKLLR